MILSFACPGNLTALADCEIWLADGTFAIYPSMSYHLWVVHGVYQDAILSLAFFLLPGKSEEVYTKAFTLLLEAIEFETKSTTWNGPEKIVLDFELAQYNAFVSVFGGQVQGCYFHYVQAVYRKLDSFKPLKILMT